MFRRLDSAQGMWIAEEAFSALFSLAVPSQKTSYGEGVPKIMQPRLVARTVKSQHSGLFSQPLELMSSMIVTDHHAYLGGKKCWRPLVSIPKNAG